VKKINEGVGNLADLLPARVHYYVLFNGVNYAQHGVENRAGVVEKGLLVFGYLEQAEKFVLTVGKFLPEFQPHKIMVSALHALILQFDGRICIADGLRITIAKLS
jgi:hypothetical protein